MSRNAWIALGVAAVIVVAIVLVVVNQDDDSSTTTTTAGAASTTTTAGESTATTAVPEGPTVRLVTDGGMDEELTVTLCENPGETTLTLVAEGDDVEDPLILELEAEGGTGTIVLSGPAESEGTVDEVMVGDTGEITATGTLTPSDDSAEEETFELTGNCA